MAPPISHPIQGGVGVGGVDGGCKGYTITCLLASAADKHFYQHLDPLPRFSRITGIYKDLHKDPPASPLPIRLGTPRLYKTQLVTIKSFVRCDWMLRLLFALCYGGQLGAGFFISNRLNSPEWDGGKQREREREGEVWILCLCKWVVLQCFMRHAS